MSQYINNSWISEPPRFELQPSTVHLWCVPLVVDVPTKIKYWNILSKEEKERANRFKFDSDKTKYITCRGVLRLLLGKYLDKPAHLVSISYIKNGKPHHHNSDLEFNVSHSNDMAVIGFTLNTIIGVDVEYTKRIIEFDEIAQRFFSEEEADEVLKSDTTLRGQYFYNCWTRKEAFIKALGDGLSFPLDQFRVSCNLYDQPRLLTTLWDASEVENWNLWGFEIASDYTGAIALKGPKKDILYLDWSHKSV